jgi:hypothetical protein
MIAKEKPWAEEVFERLSCGVFSLEKDKGTISRDNAR